jgi:murein DD-endopeptidase MepM/ murein hydrolase activator NlpD
MHRMLLIIRKKACLIICAVLLLSTILYSARKILVYHNNTLLTVTTEEGTRKDYIKWVDFNVPYKALHHALILDVQSHETDTPISWIELLAYVSAKNGNNFKNFKEKQLDEVAEFLKSGKTIEELTKDMKYYDYYYQAYDTILSGFVGEYEIEVPDENGEGKHWERRYGLKVFSPIAKTFPYHHYDDFGNSRSYGFKRIHLGNDLMGQVGTPIVAVEGGVVEALGWNQYGGWRIGIRSLDSKRYYYYAHLRKNFPYRKDLEIGSIVKAGDVIGYLGRTGYSKTENVNNIQQPHLHFGMQLIFDESQKECNNEIWIDVYQIIRLLDKQRSEVVKDPETKDYSRVYDIRECQDLLFD